MDGKTEGKNNMDLTSSMIRRGGRPQPRRMAINDPLSGGLHAQKKAELADYARNEMRLNEGIRVLAPEDEAKLEPWQKLRKFG